MLLRAAKDLDLDLDASWTVGDSPSDVEAGIAAGTRTAVSGARGGLRRGPTCRLRPARACRRDDLQPSLDAGRTLKLRHQRFIRLGNAPVEWDLRAPAQALGGQLRVHAGALQLALSQWCELGLILSPAASRTSSKTS